MGNVREDILRALSKESRELEGEIRLVQTGVDDGVDYLSPANSSRSARSGDGYAAPSQLELETALNAELGGGGLTHLSINVPGALKINKGGAGIKAGPRGGGSGGAPGSGVFKGRDEGHDAQAQAQAQAQVPRAGKSKLRGRLQAAKDEKYFLDEDFF